MSLTSAISKFFFCGVIFFLSPVYAIGSEIAGERDSGNTPTSSQNLPSLTVTFPEERSVMKGRVVNRNEREIVIEITPLHPSHTPELNFRTVHINSKTRVYKEGERKPLSVYSKELAAFQKKLDAIDAGRQEHESGLTAPQPHYMELVTEKAITSGEWIVVFADENVANKKQFSANKVLLQDVSYKDVKMPNISPL